MYERTDFLFPALIAIACILILWVRVRRRLAEDALVIPQRGEWWTLITTTDGSGPSSMAHAVLIRDVQDGWVRFYFGPNLGNDRMKLTTFVRCYRPSRYNLDH